MKFNTIKTLIRNVSPIVPSIGLKRPSDYQQIHRNLNTIMTINKSDLKLHRLLLTLNIFNKKLVNINNNISYYPIDRRLVSNYCHSSSCLSIRNYSSKQGNQTSDSSSGSDSELYDDDEDLFHEPPKVRFGLLKVALTIILGTYAGALFAMFGANFLEEFEIFVKEDDDEDD